MEDMLILEIGLICYFISLIIILGIGYYDYYKHIKHLDKLENDFNNLKKP